jgi:ABC-type sugar transport system ATPase subunit
MTVDDIIRIEHVSKRFGGARALDDVSFSVRRGEVHAVVGENGAGKSTLMKLLAGVFPPDGGRIVLSGHPVRFAGPADARRLGVSIVFQELNLFPHRSVVANIFANRELTRAGGRLDLTAMRDAAARTLADMGVNIPLDAKVGDLPLGEQQLVEIARTLVPVREPPGTTSIFQRLRSQIGRSSFPQPFSDGNAEPPPQTIILDEPNSALSALESERLFEIVRQLRAGGVTILYVSHRLEEVFAIADRITVLRDGRYQVTCNTAETTIPEVIAAMIGRQAQAAFPQRAPLSAAAPTVLQVHGLQVRGSNGRGADRTGGVGPIDFSVRAGEIVGLAGLEGAGIDELFQVLFGLTRPTAGRVMYENRPYAPRSPLAAIRRGWGLIPASRREQGLLMDWSIRHNTALLVLERLTGRFGLIDPSAMQNLAREYAGRLNIVADSLDKRVDNLSGGNQQKVLLAKWLATGPRLLLLNDPTRGVDIGAKFEIYDVCARLADEGLAILFTSSEVEEIVGLCDRVLVLHKGRLVRELARGQATKPQIMHAMSGDAAAAPPELPQPREQ